MSERSPSTRAIAGRALALCLIAALAGCSGTGPAVPGPAAVGPAAAPPDEPPAGGAETAGLDAGSPAAEEPAPPVAGPAPPPAAGVAPPDTVAGRTFGEWLALYNRGGEREIEEFIGARFAPDFLAQLPVSALVAFHLQSRETTGELAAVEIEPAGEHALDAVADGTAGGAMTISLEVEPEPPHRITRLRLVPPER